MNDEAKRLAGKREEDRLYETVSKLPGMKIFRNLYVPKGPGGQTAELDLVLLCSSGLFILESKGYATGEIVGSQLRYEWTQHIKQPGGKKKKKGMYSPLRQVDRQIAVLSRYLGIPPKLINGLVVFSSRATLKKVPAQSDSGIVVLQTHLVNSHIRRCLANRKPRFSPTELRRLQQRLDAIPHSDFIKRRHIIQAKQAEAKRKAEQARRRASHKKHC